MLTGYNTDLKFQGTVYHIQTEDGGVNSPYITSLLYKQGAILASRKTSYADILKADCRDEVVRELMIGQHKRMIRNLMSGNIEVHDAAHASTSQPAAIPKADTVEEMAPASMATPATSPTETEKEKSLDEIIMDFLSQEQKERNE